MTVIYDIEQIAKSIEEEMDHHKTKGYNENLQI